MIDTQVADTFIAALCVLIQNLTIDSLHIIGDIFDWGPRADIIMDELMAILSTLQTHASFPVAAPIQEIS